MMQANDPLRQLLVRHRSWREQQQKRDPAFFSRLAEGQRPWVFWIGCADSRTAAEHIADLNPGEAFVYRNVANTARWEDSGFAAALAFALDRLQVPLIVICGHEDCAGIKAVVSGQLSSALAEALEPIVELYRTHASKLKAYPPERQAQWLAREHVRVQTKRLAQTDPVHRARLQGRSVQIVGLFYSIASGRLRIVASA